MRRGIVIAVLAGALAFPAAAAADKEIVAATPNRFQTPEVTMDQGEPLVLRNTDPFVRHDVQATQGGEVKGKLFASEIVSNGETSFVEGSQYLTAGAYDFICSLHPDQMKGRLTVTGNGTPKPRPGGGGGGGGGGGTAPPPDTTAPAVSLAVGGPKAAKVRRARRLTITAGADEASKLTVSVRIGSRRVGTATVELATGGTRRVTVSLSKRGRALVRRGRTLVVAVKATDAAGNTGSASQSVKLR